MKITVMVEIEVPDKATHYIGDLTDEPEFYYCSSVGVAGDHWWRWDEGKQQWMFSSHYKNHWLCSLEETTVKPG